MRVLLLSLLVFITATSFGQTKGPTILDARRHGVEVLTRPQKGILKVDISEEYQNIVMVYLCDYKGGVPLACKENYNVTMTTATGRVKTITDYKKYSLGTIRPEEFPLTIDVKVTGLRGQERYPLQFSLKLLYKGFCHRIYLYDEWTGVKGIQ